ncbi:hypothetical protein ACEN9Z_17975, partial [Stenotrophomonas geniculata]
MGVPQLPLALHYPRDQRLETFIGAPDGALAQLQVWVAVFLCTQSRLGMRGGFAAAFLARLQLEVL